MDIQQTKAVECHHRHRSMMGTDNVWLWVLHMYYKLMYVTTNHTNKGHVAGYKLILVAHKLDNIALLWLSYFQNSRHDEGYCCSVGHTGFYILRLSTTTSFPTYVII